MELKWRNSWISRALVLARRIIQMFLKLQRATVTVASRKRKVKLNYSHLLRNKKECVRTEYQTTKKSTGNRRIVKNARNLTAFASKTTSIHLLTATRTTRMRQSKWFVLVNTWNATRTFWKELLRSLFAIRNGSLLFFLIWELKNVDPFLKESSEVRVSVPFETDAMYKTRRNHKNGLQRKTH